MFKILDVLSLSTFYTLRNFAPYTVGLLHILSLKRFVLRWFALRPFALRHLVPVSKRRWIAYINDHIKHKVMCKVVNTKCLKLKQIIFLKSHIFWNIPYCSVMLIFIVRLSLIGCLLHLSLFWDWVALLLGPFIMWFWMTRSIHALYSTLFLVHENKINWDTN